MQHLVVLEVVQQHRRDALGARGHHHGRAGHPVRPGVLEVGEEQAERQASLGEHPRELRSAALPGGHGGEDHRPDGQREPAAVHELEQVRPEEGHVHRKEERHQRACRRARPPPALARAGVEQQRGDRHRPGDRHAVGLGQIGRLAEGDHQDHAQHHERAVHRRHVDLTVRGPRGVHDGEARHVAQLHRLLGERERPRDQRLRGDDRRDRGEGDQGIEAPRRRQLEEGVAQRVGVLEQQNALPEVVEQERRQNHGVPSPADRPRAEVAHVGVERLAAGDHQDHRAQDQEAVQPVLPQEAQPVQGAHRAQHRDVVAALRQDAGEPGGGEHQEPEQHRRAEDRGDARRAVALHGEQGDQDPRRDRQDVGVEGAGRHTQTLHGREHRDRGRDDPVAVEQRRAEQAEQQEGEARHGARAVRFARLDQREQGEDPALAVVVRAHDEREVLDGDHQQERPDDQRQDAQDVGVRDLERVLAEEALAQRVERRGADVAVDHAEGAQRQHAQRPVHVAAAGRSSLALAPVLGVLRSVRLPARRALGRGGASRPLSHGSPSPRARRAAHAPRRAAPRRAPGWARRASRPGPGRAARGRRPRPRPAPPVRPSTRDAA